MLRGAVAFKRYSWSQAWRCVSVTTAFERLRKEDSLWGQPELHSQTFQKAKNRYFKDSEVVESRNRPLQHSESRHSSIATWGKEGGWDPDTQQRSQRRTGALGEKREMVNSAFSLTRCERFESTEAQLIVRDSRERSTSGMEQWAAQLMRDSSSNIPRRGWLAGPYLGVRTPEPGSQTSRGVASSSVRVRHTLGR